MLTTQQTEEQLTKACVMGWSVEMLQAFLIISDDISDNSITRRGKPCWYRLGNVGLMFAICDILSVENGLYRILKTYFQQEPYYGNVMDLFHDVALQTTIGQTLDNCLSSQNLDIDRYNQDNYKALCHNKAGLYTYYLPLALAMHMVTIPDEEVLKETAKICLQLGELFQAKNDYADCFGDAITNGKIGTDIEEGKCTWLIVNALELIREEERHMLMMWYGKKDPLMAKLVYNKYLELQLDRLFAEYEMKMCNAIATDIEQLPPICPTNILYYCLDTLHNSP